MTRLRQKPGWVAIVLVTAAVLTGVVGVAAETTGTVGLTAGSFESGGGNSTGGEFGVASGAGQLAVGDAQGGAIGLGSGLQTKPDACPTEAGPDSRQGCFDGVRAVGDLHVIDQAGAGECETLTGAAASSCKVPLDGLKVKVFDRNRLNGLEITTRDHRTVTLTKNPDGQLYDDIFASGIAHGEALAAPLGCVTGPSPHGECTAGVAQPTDLLVITRYTPPDRTTPLWTGKPAGPRDFADTDGDGTGDRLTRDFQIIKTIKPGGVEYSGGNKTVLTGSYLEVVGAEVAAWSAGGADYPFSLDSDSPWQVTLCLKVPTGYAVTAVTDEGGFPLSSVLSGLGAVCTRRSVDRNSLAVVAHVAPVGRTSAPPTVDAVIDTLHEGKRKVATVSIPALDVASLAGGA